MARTVTIDWSGGSVTAIDEGSGGTGVLLAHGAGTDQHHPSISLVRRGLAAGGLRAMSFNYPYTERGVKRPDRPEVLLAAHRAAADRLAAAVDGLFLAGRSMGGRIGTYLAAEGYPASGLVLYAYPLHPAGKPDKLRVDQFGSITQPMLFFQGTNDALSRMDLFDRHIRALPGVEIELLEGAGHGFRGGGWSLERIVDRYVSVTLAWIERQRYGKSA